LSRPADPVSDLLSRREHFTVVGSTNDVVREWLADGTPEVCLAIADEQTAGRGRDGRSWTAPAGSSVLLSLGFRPSWLRPEHAWRLAALVSLAMAEAADVVVGRPSGTVHLKWPNDLVAIRDGGVRKLAGVLGETDGLGTADPRAVVGIGVNVDWDVSDFPADLAGSMTSLREIAGRPIDREAMLDEFLARLASRIQETRLGGFQEAEWVRRQVTTGRVVDLGAPDGSHAVVRATGVDPDSGALLVEDPDAPGTTRPVLVGEISHVRLAEPIVAGV
jgi:BirA family transcriptional regulator, biotin operon repressor / biotin---[acetyl-CoA-carboxylase] ligase